MLEVIQGLEAPMNTVPEVVPPQEPEFGHESIAEISVVGPVSETITMAAC